MSAEMFENHYSSSMADMIDGMMPQQMKEVVSSQPIIPVIAARAKEIIKKESNFVRSDQGQILEISKELEIPYGPSNGLPELREAVASFWNAFYELYLPLDSDNVCIVTGATEGLSLVLKLVSYREKIGILPLHWSNYRGIIKACHGEPVVIDIFDNRGNLDLDMAEDQVRQHGIRTLLVNFPTNPTGESLDRSEYERFAAFIRDMDLLVISDEVYGALRLDGQCLSMLQFLPHRTILIGGASKEFLIPGARVGYVICYDKKIAGQWLPRLVRASTSNPNVPGQNAFLPLLKQTVKDLQAGKEPGLLSEIKNNLVKRRDTLIEVLGKCGLSVIRRKGQQPVGGISLLARLPEDIDESDKDFVELALTHKKFSAVPGSSFGFPGTLRIGYGGMTIGQIRQFGRNLQELLDVLRSADRSA
ncbi:pyridoxal phosphate-dependent aminotransferase [Acidobacteriota bacterium]